MSGETGSAPARKDLIEAHRPVIPYVHPNVILTGERLEAAVRVAVQIDGAAAHLVPGEACRTSRENAEAVA